MVEPLREIANTGEKQALLGKLVCSILDGKSDRLSVGHSDEMWSSFLGHRSGADRDESIDLVYSLVNSLYVVI